MLFCLLSYQRLQYVLLFLQGFGSNNCSILSLAWIPTRQLSTTHLIQNQRIVSLVTAKTTTNKLAKLQQKRWKHRHSTSRFIAKQEEEAEEDDDDDDPPDVDIANFNRKQEFISYGYNRGRSSPSHRKAIGGSPSSSTNVYICNKCCSEYVQWMGKCSTCNQWNTLEQHTVLRRDVSKVSSKTFQFDFDDEIEQQYGQQRQQQRNRQHPQRLRSSPLSKIFLEETESNYVDDDEEFYRKGTTS